MGKHRVVIAALFAGNAGGGEFLPLDADTCFAPNPAGCNDRATLGTKNPGFGVPGTFHDALTYCAQGPILVQRITDF